MTERTHAELREIAIINVRQTTAQFPGIGIVVMLFNRGKVLTPVALSTAVDSPEQAIRLLREMADKLERDDKLMIKPV